MPEIAKHADKLKTMEELGHGETAHTFAFALTPPPTVDQIRDAIKKLRDPEQRIVDEFFWFWPSQFGKSAHDPAIQALAAGDRETALEIWTMKETSPTEGVAAMHNVAILWHLVALEWEEYADQEKVDDERKRKIERYWRDAFKRWEHLATDDAFWETVSQRVKQTDDAGLTTGFVRRMRAALPQALDKINAELAIRHAERGRIELARLHVEFMRETNPGRDNVEKTLESVLGPATTRLKQQIERATQCVGENPAEAAKAARELLGYARSSVAIYDVLLGLDNDIRNDLFDDVASVCNLLLVTYRKATDDYKTCLEIAKVALPFAATTQVREQLKQNMDVWNGFVASKALALVYSLLKQIEDSSEHPRARLDRFRDEAISSISAVAGAVTVSSSFGPIVEESKTELFNSAAIVLRGISLASWNTYQDKKTALAANELALEHACDQELRKKLFDDQRTLRPLVSKPAPQPVSPQSSSKRSSLGTLLGKFARKIGL